MYTIFKNSIKSRIKMSPLNAQEITDYIAPEKTEITETVEEGLEVVNEQETEVEEILEIISRYSSGWFNIN